jgi:hypothetical protein
MVVVLGDPEPPLPRAAAVGGAVGEKVWAAPDSVKRIGAQRKTILVYAPFRRHHV